MLSRLRWVKEYWEKFLVVKETCKNNAAEKRKAFFREGAEMRWNGVVNKRSAVKKGEREEIFERKRLWKRNEKSYNIIIKKRRISFKLN